MQLKRIGIMFISVLMLCSCPGQVFASELSFSTENISSEMYDAVIFDESKNVTEPEGWEGKTEEDYIKASAQPTQGFAKPSEVVLYSSASGEWVKSSDGRWWYRYSDGTYPANCWAYIDGYWYHFDADGWMQTGWLYLNGTWYYLSSSGAMVTGWQQISGTRYYFDSSGAMAIGWKKISGTWYYFDSSGALVSEDSTEDYHGYAGVNIWGDYYGISASIQTPSSLPFVADSGESVWVSTQIDSNGHWVQTGARYYDGYTSFKTYTEHYSNGTYTRTTIGVHQVGVTVPYKVEYSSSDGKWHAYINGSDKASSTLSSSALGVQTNAEIHRANIEMGPFYISNLRVKSSSSSWTNNTKKPSTALSNYSATGTATSFTLYGPN